MAQPDLIVRARNLYSKLGRYSHGSFRSGVHSWIESAITKKKKNSRQLRGLVVDSSTLLAPEVSGSNPGWSRIF